MHDAGREVEHRELDEEPAAEHEQPGACAGRRVRAASGPVASMPIKAQRHEPSRLPAEPDPEDPHRAARAAERHRLEHALATTGVRGGLGFGATSASPLAGGCAAK